MIGIVRRAGSVGKPFIDASSASNGFHMIQQMRRCLALALIKSVHCYCKVVYIVDSVVFFTFIYEPKSDLENVNMASYLI